MRLALLVVAGLALMVAVVAGVRLKGALRDDRRARWTNALELSLVVALVSGTFAVVVP